MYNRPAKCMTFDCGNMSYELQCPTCAAQEATARSFQATVVQCEHGHSITGEYQAIMRQLPTYMGGHPQPGYMLDVCKLCLQELQERPYNPIRRGTQRGDSARLQPTVHIK
jgi:hypothetical protein